MCAEILPSCIMYAVASGYVVQMLSNLHKHKKADDNKDDNNSKSGTE